MNAQIVSGESRVVASRRTLRPNDFAPHGEATQLAVGEPKPTAAKLFAQNAILFPEIVDHGELFPVDPSGEQQK